VVELIKYVRQTPPIKKVSGKSEDQKLIDLMFAQCLDLDDYYFRCKCLRVVEDMR